MVFILFIHSPTLPPHSSSSQFYIVSPPLIAPLPCHPCHRCNTQHISIPLSSVRNFRKSSEFRCSAVRHEPTTMSDQFDDAEPTTLELLNLTAPRVAGAFVDEVQAEDQLEEEGEYDEEYEEW